MERKITLRELKNIRKAIEAIPGRCDTTDMLFVSIALPHDCNKETKVFAERLMSALKKVNCKADISFLLTYSREIKSDKPYEVLPYIPIATPCIRVYDQRYIARPDDLQKAGNSLKSWLGILRKPDSKPKRSIV